MTQHFVQHLLQTYALDESVVKKRYNISRTAFAFVFKKSREAVIKLTSMVASRSSSW